MRLFRRKRQKMNVRYVPGVAQPIVIPKEANVKFTGNNRLIDWRDLSLERSERDSNPQDA